MDITKSNIELNFQDFVEHKAWVWSPIDDENLVEPLRQFFEREGLWPKEITGMPGPDIDIFAICRVTFSDEQSMEAVAVIKHHIAVVLEFYDNGPLKYIPFQNIFDNGAELLKIKVWLKKEETHIFPIKISINLPEYDLVFDQIVYNAPPGAEYRVTYPNKEWEGMVP